MNFIWHCLSGSTRKRFQAMSEQLVLLWFSYPLSFNFINFISCTTVRHVHIGFALLCLIRAAAAQLIVKSLLNPR